MVFPPFSIDVDLSTLHNKCYFSHELHEDILSQIERYITFLKDELQECDIVCNDVLPIIQDYVCSRIINLAQYKVCNMILSNAQEVRADKQTIDLSTNTDLYLLSERQQGIVTITFTLTT